MKINELKKIYKFDEIKKNFVLEVQLENYHNAYSDWDFSPFTNRDLNKDLTQYLLDCSYEIPLKHALQIKFFLLNQDENKKRESRSIKGIHNYFEYELRKLSLKYLKTMRNIMTFTIIGVGLLMASMYFKRYQSLSLMFSVLLEGLFIGGWVMLWEMFSAFFFDLQEIGTVRKHFNRLKSSEIQYLYGRRGEV